MGLKWNKVSVDEAAASMGLTDRERDNIKNRINKRVMKMVADLGVESAGYKKFARNAGEMGFKMTLVNRKMMQTIYKVDIDKRIFEPVTEEVTMQILSRGQFAKGMSDKNLLYLDKLTKEESSRKTLNKLLDSSKTDTSKLSKDDKLDVARQYLGKTSYIEKWFDENPDLIYEVLVEKGWENIRDHSTDEIYKAVQEIVGKGEEARKESLGGYSSWADRYEKEGGDSLRIRRKQAEQEAMTGGRAARRQAATQRKKAKYTI